MQVSCSSVLSWTRSACSSTRSYGRRYLYCVLCTVFCTILYCTVLYCTILYCTVLYCTGLQDRIQFSTVLYCTLLHCTVLYYTVLYCTVLGCRTGYSSVLYCTVLYCTVLYCTILYCTVLGCRTGYSSTTRPTLTSRRTTQRRGEAEMRSRVPQFRHRYFQKVASIQLSCRVDTVCRESCI